MKYIEAPSIYEINTKDNTKSIFLAGGISNCPNWQKEIIEDLKNENIVILNPKRKDFDISNPDIEKEQITWEFEHLNNADAVSFWFPQETVCPITLYELGKQSMTRKPVFIGIHPNYSRIRDVEIQTKLIRPEINIVYDLKSLSNQIKEWIRK